LNYSIQKSGTSKFKVKRSEFLSYTVPINNHTELNNYIKELKGQHQTARHFCWAYRIHDKNETVENFSDAGEPSGSAGIPILNAIRSANIINCGVIVIRYFGGVKLGKRGLINAYNTSASMAIAESDIKKWTPKINLLLKGDISYYGNVLNIVKRFGGKIITDISSEQFNLEIEIPKKEHKDFSVGFKDITQNSGVIKKQSEHDQTKEVRK